MLKIGERINRLRGGCYNAYMTDKILIAGNWKMFPTTLADAKKILQTIKKGTVKLKYTETVICAPTVFLSELSRLVTGKKISLGAQSVFFEREGAYTGETSPAMLKSIKIKTTIVGHSERRAMGETDEEVGEKTVAALREGLNVILCVGETVRDHDGTYTRVISNQLRAALSRVQRPQVARLAIAYEPVWAIGKNAERPATPEDVLEISILIKKVLADAYGQQNAEHVPILYGGSVDHTNAKGFLLDGNVRGLLVGRASLSARSFAEILAIADSIEASRKKKK